MSEYEYGPFVWFIWRKGNHVAILNTNNDALGAGWTIVHGPYHDVKQASAIAWAMVGFITDAKVAQRNKDVTI
jgi:hypothetical protein